MSAINWTRNRYHWHTDDQKYMITARQRQGVWIVTLFRYDPDAIYKVIKLLYRADVTCDRLVEEAKKEAERENYPQS